MTTNAARAADARIAPEGHPVRKNPAAPAQDRRRPLIEVFVMSFLTKDQNNRRKPNRRNPRKSAAARIAAAIESLEPRQLLSGEPWSAAAKLTGQDKAAANYP